MKRILILNPVKHLNERRNFECQYCNMSFGSDYSQHRHIDKVHLGSSDPSVGNSGVYSKLSSSQVSEVLIEEVHDLPASKPTHPSKFSSSQVSETLIKKECDLPSLKPTLSSSTSECVIQLQHEGIKEEENDSSKQQENSMQPGIQKVRSFDKSTQEKVCVKSENRTIKQEELRPLGEESDFEQKFALHEFSCDICGRCFREKNKLHRHMSVHSDYRKYCCASCGSRFKRKDDMDRHVKRQVCAKSIQRSRERSLKRSSSASGVKVESSIFEHERNQMNVNFNEEPLLLQQERDEMKSTTKREDEEFLYSHRTNTNPSHLDNHMKTFRCYNCYFPFTHEDHLEIHLKNKVCTKLKSPKSSVPVAKDKNSEMKPKVKSSRKRKTISVRRAISRKYKLRRKSGALMTFSESIRMLSGQASDIVCIETSESELDMDDQNWCGKCGKGFAKKSKLHQHMKFAHSDNREYTCESCDSRFKSSYHLSRHLKGNACLRRTDDDSGVPEYCCKNCDMCFQSKDLLTEHLSEQFCSKPRIFQRSSFNCVVKLSRNKIARGKYELLEKGMTKLLKETTSLKKRQYKCHTCSQTFAFAAQFERHRMSVHFDSRPHKCDVCGSRHRCMTDLRKHMWKHKDIERPRRYKCEVCSRGCDSLTTLRRHYSVHSEARPFGCKLCTKSYKYKEDLKKHHLHVHPSEKYETYENKQESQVI